MRSTARLAAVAVVVVVLAAGCSASGTRDVAGLAGSSTTTAPSSERSAPSTTESSPVQGEPPRATLSETRPGDHWHQAFAVSICSEEQAPLEDAMPDYEGIHTHGDGFIHVHPFTLGASGRRATLEKFFDQTGVEVVDGRYTDADGEVVAAADTPCDGQPSEWVLAHWDDAATAEDQPPDDVITTGIAQVRFTADSGAYTLALVPKGDRAIAAPFSAADIGELTGGG